uniref:Uncharacterized protein n=1 Tax=Arundo donax TaxID=35708 RepID=A0A0A8ZYP2_ARUDO
MSSNDMEDRNS